MTTKTNSRARRGEGAAFGIYVDLRTGGPSRKAILYSDPDPLQPPKGTS